MLGRRDRRPAGAAAFATFFAGGAGGWGECGEFDPHSFSKPTIRVPGTYAYGPSSRPDTGETSVAAMESICFFRFEEKEPIEVLITSPTGTVKQFEGCVFAFCESNLSWFALPGDPLGTYRVTAMQGSLRATGSFRLRPAQDRTLLLPESWLHSGTTQRGTTIRIGVAGFRPYEVVKLLLYYAPKRGVEGRYRTSVSVRMDAMGQRLYQLQTGPSDPTGFYAVRTLPGFDVMWRESEFTFRLV